MKDFFVRRMNFSSLLICLICHLFVYKSVYRCVVISYVGRCCVWMEIYHLILSSSILYIVYVGLVLKLLEAEHWQNSLGDT
jgi:hypothetical protein